MPLFEHPLQLFTLEHPEGWEPRYQEETGALMIVRPGLADASALSFTPLAVTGSELDLDERLLEIAGRLSVEIDPGAIAHQSQDGMRIAYAEGDRSADDNLGRRFRLWIVQHGALALHVAQLGPGAGRQAERDAADAVLRSLTFPELMPPTPQEFQARVISVVEQEYAPIRVARRGEWAIDLIGEEGDTIGTVGLENLYRSCLLSAESAGALIREYLDQVVGATGGVTGYGEFDSVRGRLLPVIKPLGWLEEVPGRVEMLSVEFAPGLAVCFAIDEPTRMAFATREMLNDWGVPLERVQEIAQDNLAHRTGELEMVVVPGADQVARALIVNTRDGYDASRLLLPGVREAFAEELGDHYLVGLPNRDFLIAFNEADTETATGIVRQIKHDYQRMHHPITATIYRAGPDSLEPTEL